MYGVIDIGGTKTVFALMDQDRSLIDPKEIPTPVAYPDLLEQIKTYFNDKDFKTLGVSTAGYLKRSEGVRMKSFGPNIPWPEQSITEDIHKATEKKALVENDANCGAIGEAVYGAGQEYESVLYVTISTGIGTGFVYNKKLTAATADSEGGKILYMRDGELKRLEEFVSGKAIKNRYGTFASEIEDDDIWQEITQDLAPGIQAMATMFAPKVIVFGGSIGKQFDKFSAHLDRFFDANRYSSLPIPKFVKASDTSKSVLLGAYELARSLDTGESIWS